MSPRLVGRRRDSLLLQFGTDNSQFIDETSLHLLVTNNLSLKSRNSGLDCLHLVISRENFPLQLDGFVLDVLLEGRDAPLMTALFIGALDLIGNVAISLRRFLRLDREITLDFRIKDSKALVVDKPLVNCLQVKQVVLGISRAVVLDRVDVTHDYQEFDVPTHRNAIPVGGRNEARSVLFGGRVSIDNALTLLTLNGVDGRNQRILRN